MKKLILSFFIIIGFNSVSYAELKTDTVNFNITGEITAPTCEVNMSETPTIELGIYQPQPVPVNPKSPFVSDFKTFDLVIECFDSGKPLIMKVTSGQPLSDDPYIIPLDGGSNSATGAGVIIHFLKGTWQSLAYNEVTVIDKVKNGKNILNMRARYKQYPYSVLTGGTANANVTITIKQN